MTTFLLLLTVTLCVSMIMGAFCHGHPYPNAKNTQVPDTSAPVLLNSTTNGKLFMVGPKSQKLLMAHVWGTVFEMGQAQGELLKYQLLRSKTLVTKYLESQIVDQSFLDSLPLWLADILAKDGLDAALDATYEITKSFSPKYMWEEMEGIARGVAGEDTVLEDEVYLFIRRLAQIGELTKGGCSAVGAFGEAVAPGIDLLQVRAFDWNVNFCEIATPLIVVYHPSTGAAMPNQVANIGFAGLPGVITATNDKRMAVSQIGVSYPDASFGEESRVGENFQLMLRRLVDQYSTIEQCTAHMKDTTRTCDLIIAAGAGNEKDFQTYQYSFSTLTPITWNNLLPENTTWHPEITDINYQTMDWLCPNFDEKMASQLAANFGSKTFPLTPKKLTFQDLIVASSQVTTGNLQSIVFSFEDGGDKDMMYVSFATPQKEKGHCGYFTCAYDRQFVGIDMKAMWNEPKP